MALGGGKYDELCTKVRLSADADGAIVIVLNGHDGSGFSCQLDRKGLLMLPDILEELARTIRADASASAAPT